MNIPHFDFGGTGTPIHFLHANGYPPEVYKNLFELLQKQYHGKLDEKADKYLTYILQASDRMKVLIKDLLDYSRIGKAESQVKVDCNVVLEETLADLTVVIKETGADITSDPLPVITGYPTEMKQLFQNLLTNAIKFRRKDVSPKIRITVRKNKNAFEFSFKDNGKGIEPHVAERIFLSHFSTKKSGSGLGLAIAKQAIEQMQGMIWFDTIVGQGTTFYIELPAVQ